MQVFDEKKIQELNFDKSIENDIDVETLNFIYQKKNEEKKKEERKHSKDTKKSFNSNHLDATINEKKENLSEIKNLENEINNFQTFENIDKVEEVGDNTGEFVEENELPKCINQENKESNFNQENNYNDKEENDYKEEENINIIKALIQLILIGHMIHLHQIALLELKTKYYKELEQIFLI